MNIHLAIENDEKSTEISYATKFNQQSHQKSKMKNRRKLEQKTQPNRHIHYKHN
jgi:hypothetical protein